MSSKQNTKMWIATADDLRDVILREKVAQVNFYHIWNMLIFF